MIVLEVGKREFIQHTSKYLKKAEGEDKIIITHNNKPVLELHKLKTKTIYDLRGLISEIKIEDDINDHVFPGYDEWF